MSPRAVNLAFLSAVTHTAGSLGFSSEGMRLIITLEDAGARSFLEKTVNNLYGGYTEESKRDIVIKGGMLDMLLTDCGILTKDYALRAGIDRKLIHSDLTKTAYIRGAFIGCGSVYVKSGYHLEFPVSNELLAKDILSVLSHFNIQAKTLVRGAKTVAYVKGADGVSDTLALLGASKAVLELNSRFVDRQIKQLANRRSNCDLANIDKTVSAGERQRGAIQKLMNAGIFGSLDIKLKQAGQARLDNPDLSLAETAELLCLTKSGLSHRLNKLIDISLNI